MASCMACSSCLARFSCSGQTRARSHWTFSGWFRSMGSRSIPILEAILGNALGSGGSISPRSRHSMRTSEFGSPHCKLSPYLYWYRSQIRVSPALDPISISERGRPLACRVRNSKPGRRTAHRAASLVWTLALRLFYESCLDVREQSFESVHKHSRIVSMYH